MLSGSENTRAGALTIRLQVGPGLAQPALLQQDSLILLGNEQVQVSAAELRKVLLTLLMEEGGWVARCPPGQSGPGQGPVRQRSAGEGNARGLDLTSMCSIRMGSASCRVMTSGGRTVSKIQSRSGYSGLRATWF